MKTQNFCFTCSYCGAMDATHTAWESVILQAACQAWAGPGFTPHSLHS